MTGRTPPEAVKNFITPLQRALGCVTRVRLGLVGEAGSKSPYQPADRPHGALLGNGSPVWLEGDAEIALRVRQRYRLVDTGGAAKRWRAATTGYDFALYDKEQQEILAFHWHPGSRSRVSAPHAHIGPGAINQADLARAGLPRASVALRDDLGKAHLPTGPITLVQVIRLAIEDFGVRPLQGNWVSVLAQCEAAIET